MQNGSWGTVGWCLSATPEDSLNKPQVNSITVTLMQHRRETRDRNGF